MEQSLRDLVNAFADNPAASGRELRELARQSGEFTEAALPLLAELSESHGYRYLIVILLRGESLLEAICSPTFYTIPQAVAVTKIALTVDPQFDLRLALRINSIEDEKNTARILTILETASGSARLRSFLAELLSHHNDHVRSKAALLLGRSNRNPNWAENQMSDADLRVRANAVEALWDSNHPDCAAFFQKVAGDSNCRVAGNALVGLYRLHCIRGIQLLHDMADDADVSRQITAAWVMGNTGDARFLLTLTSLMNAGDPKLRWTSMQAMARIRRAIEMMKKLGRLTVAVWPTEGVSNGSGKAAVTITSSGCDTVPDLRPMEFFLSGGGQPLLDFAISELQPAPALNIGFAVPLTGQAALRACLLQKRPFDEWAIQKYASDASDADSTQSVHFTQDTGALSGMLQDRGSRYTVASGLAAALTELTGLADGCSGPRRVVFVSDSAAQNQMQQQEALSISARAIAAKVMICGILAPQCEDAAQLKQLCKETGGAVYRASASGQIPAMLLGICRSLLSCYEIAHSPATQPPGDLKLEIHSKMHGYGEAALRTP